MQIIDMTLPMYYRAITRETIDSYNLLNNHNTGWWRINIIFFLNCIAWVTRALVNNVHRQFVLLRLNFVGNNTSHWLRKRSRNINFNFSAFEKILLQRESTYNNDMIIINEEITCIHLQQNRGSANDDRLLFCTWGKENFFFLSINFVCVQKV